MNVYFVVAVAAAGVHLKSCQSGRAAVRVSCRNITEPASVSDNETKRMQREALHCKMSDRRVFCVATVH